MTVLRLSEDDPQAFASALRALREGALVALPTDTVYGIAAHAMQPVAVERIFAAKGRPHDKPIPLLLADVADVPALAVDIPPAMWRLAARFWPGPLTLVLRRSARVPDVVAGGGETVAVRIPDHPFPRRLIEALGVPLATTSANRSGHPSPLTAGAVERELGHALRLIVDGGPASGGQPSTLLDLTSVPPRLLRAGPVTREDIAAVLGEEQVA
ncbi:MAG: threonylcarbamoyl-AMP synthase [Chloroflexi bacterium]|nr:threonylcarbamoyl-AMP synthase [Chloroflexota bacterium]